ncbi:hypothetical protein ACFV8Z_46635 [Streptomyces sp. NPDC059837]|uniref:hypothetical protein n=1 Tax=unclassified Streptomyces TaxID=2593676 RepID=UPI002255B968|nr:MULTISPECIES: hypothetical protein [unclassified Streptomyces]MCX4407062.1 hypothetical protein [Streptomyces sp. NBC_01764]MCX5188250.1 hypothetical protein [Streptomyces sp. NBC_00268]
MADELMEELVGQWGQAHAPDPVRERIRQTRIDDYAVNPGLVVEGSRGMGAAVFAHAGQPAPGADRCARRAAESDAGHVAGLAAGTVIRVNGLGGASLAQITGVPCSALLVPMVVIGGIVAHAERRLVPGRGR